MHTEAPEVVIEALRRFAHTGPATRVLRVAAAGDAGRPVARVGIPRHLSVAQASRGDLSHTRPMSGPEDAGTRSPVAALFDTVADDYDQTGIDFFEPIAAGLVAALDPQPGEPCVDLGCGRGAVTLGLAERGAARGARSWASTSAAACSRTPASWPPRAGSTSTCRLSDAE